MYQRHEHFWVDLRTLYIFIIIIIYIYLFIYLFISV